MIRTLASFGSTINAARATPCSTWCERCSLPTRDLVSWANPLSQRSASQDETGGWQRTARINNQQLTITQSSYRIEQERNSDKMPVLLQLNDRLRAHSLPGRQLPCRGNCSVYSPVHAQQ